MINAQDLRIGNWVGTGGYRVQIKSLAELFCHTTAKEGKVMHSYEFVHPIPLTPEILIACGFQKVRQDGGYEYFNHEKLTTYFFISRFDATGIKYSLVFTEGGVSYTPNSYANFKYLHQLQNLFYILTSKELKSKP